MHHSCGNRHCPQCQQHKPQQWLHHQLDTQLPGPHFLIPFTVPETLRPFIRSPQRIASPALFKASATALKRLATDERCIGTHLPGFPGILHTWGRQLQYHPHIHSIVPGGGLSKDRSQWLASRANFFVPVKALSPISRALFTQEVPQAGLLPHLDPQGWTIHWNVHSQANPHGGTSFTSLAPSVFQGAISNRRIVSLTGRTVTFSSRNPGSARPRTTTLDGIAFLRSFLQHVLPDGFMKVRHCGCMNASCAIPADTMRLMISTPHPIACDTPHVAAPSPCVASCPICGAPMPLVRRFWNSHRAFVDTR